MPTQCTGTDKLTYNQIKSNTVLLLYETDVLLSQNHVKNEESVNHASRTFHSVQVIVDDKHRLGGNEKSQLKLRL